MTKTALILSAAMLFSSALVASGCTRTRHVYIREQPKPAPRVLVPPTRRPVVRRPIVRRPIVRRPVTTHRRMDYRVKRALDALRIRYSLTSAGNFRAKYNMGGGRTETVFFQSKTYRLGSVEVREIYGLGATSRGRPFSQRISAMLLIASEQNKLGAWQVEYSKGVYTAYFSVKVRATLSGQKLRSVISMVLNATQTMKKKLGIR